MWCRDWTICKSQQVVLFVPPFVYGVLGIQVLPSLELLWLVLCIVSHIHKLLVSCDRWNSIMQQCQQQIIFLNLRGMLHWQGYPRSGPERQPTALTQIWACGDAFFQTSMNLSTSCRMLSCRCHLESSTDRRACVEESTNCCPSFLSHRNCMRQLV